MDNTGISRLFELVINFRGIWANDMPKQVQHLRSLELWCIRTWKRQVTTSFNRQIMIYSPWYIDEKGPELSKKEFTGHDTARELVVPAISLTPPESKGVSNPSSRP